MRPCGLRKEEEGIKQVGPKEDEKKDQPDNKYLKEINF